MANNTNNRQLEGNEKEVEEGFALLLGGGFSTEAFRDTSGWDAAEQDDEEDGKAASCHKADCHRFVSSDTTTLRSNFYMETNAVKVDNGFENNQYNNDESEAMMKSLRHLFANAFRSVDVCSGNYIPPPVRIVALPNRGYGLLATKSLKRGEVIFTEQPLASVQLPSNCHLKEKCKAVQEEEEEESHQSNGSWLYKVRACQQCFQSLEPASCLSAHKQTATTVTSNAPHHEVSCTQKDPEGGHVNNHDNRTKFRTSSPGCAQDLPMAHLWPIEEWQPQEVTSPCSPSQHNHPLSPSSKNKPFYKSRSICSACSAAFCSHLCRNKFSRALGSCCVASAASQAVYNTVCSGKHSEKYKDNNDATGVVGVVGEEEQLPILLLATRMFVMCHHDHQQNSVDNVTEQHESQFGNVSKNKNKKKCSSNMKLFDGVHGKAGDISLLQLGEATKSNNNAEERYTLQRVFDAVCQALHKDRVHTHNCVNDPSCSCGCCTLETFHQCTAIVAQNAFATQTQSPFSTYYQALRRATGGQRGTVTSEKHTSAKRDLAKVLGSKDGTLMREMEDRVAEKCVVQVGALLALASKMNHDCNPNAELRCGDYIDHHVDIVARRDIAQGEEITLSYIQLGPGFGQRARKDGQWRRRILKAKYLFDCECGVCMGEKA